MERKHPPMIEKNVKIKPTNPHNLVKKVPIMADQ